MTPLLTRHTRTRLPIPARLPANLGYDAVGMPAEHGQRILHRLPTAGCVYAVDHRWWWIVPAGSDIDVSWPSGITYSVGAYITSASGAAGITRARPRLVHHPQADSPYTPPIPLYFLTCHVAGIVPYWSLGGGRSEEDA